MRRRVMWRRGVRHTGSFEVSGEAVKFVSGHFTGPVAFDSATVTLEDYTLCGPLRVTDSVEHFEHCSW